MDKIDIEAQAMTKQFTAPPPDSWYESRIKPISWQLVEGSMKGKKVLDVGCASGWVSWWAIKEGADITACDIYSSGVHKSLNFTKCPKEKMPFDDNSFDMVITANVLHHGDLEKGLFEIKRVLKEGGEFISLQEPCIANEENEQEYLKKYATIELEMGIDEHRPSLVKYKKALSIFKSVEFYQVNDPMWTIPTSNIFPLIKGENYAGGMAIKAIK